MIDASNFLNYVDRITPQWLAGFFDGEGSISSSFDNYGNVKLRVEVSQKNEYIIYLIMMKFPGTIVKTLQNTKLGKNTHHRIHWDGKQSIPFMEYIKDYTIVKHNLVTTALELARLFQQGNAKISVEANKERNLLKDRLNGINDSNRRLNVV